MLNTASVPMSVRSPSPETQPDSPCRAWPLRRVGQPSPDARNGIGELGRRPSDSAADRIVCAVAGPDFSQALLNGHVLAVWARDHVAVDQRVRQVAPGRCELAAEFTSQAALRCFDDGAGVMGDQPADCVAGMLDVAQVAGAVQGMKAGPGVGKAGRVADVMQPGGRSKQIDIATQKRGQAARPRCDALRVSPSARQRYLQDRAGGVFRPVV